MFDPLQSALMVDGILSVHFSKRLSAGVRVSISEGLSFKQPIF